MDQNLFIFLSLIPNDAAIGSFRGVTGSWSVPGRRSSASVAGTCFGRLFQKPGLLPVLRLTKQQAGVAAGGCFREPQISRHPLKPFVGWYCSSEWRILLNSHIAFSSYHHFSASCVLLLWCKIPALPSLLPLFPGVLLPCKAAVVSRTAKWISKWLLSFWTFLQRFWPCFGGCAASSPSLSFQTKGRTFSGGPATCGQLAICSDHTLNKLY